MSIEIPLVTNIKYIKDTLYTINKDIDIIDRKVKEALPFIKLILCGAVVGVVGKTIITIHNNYIEHENEINTLKTSIDIALSISTKMYNSIVDNDEATRIYRLIYACARMSDSSMKKSKMTAIHELHTIKTTIKNLMYELDYLINSDTVHSTSHIDNL